MGSMKPPLRPFFPEMSAQLFVGGGGAGGRAAIQMQGLRVSTEGTLLCPGERRTDRHIHRNRVKAAKTDRVRWSETERKRENRRGREMETVRHTEMDPEMGTETESNNQRGKAK